MSIEFRCQSCSRILRTPDESAGKKARCPQCSAIVDIPQSSTLTEGDASGQPGDFPAGPLDSTPPPSSPFPSFPTSPSSVGNSPNPFAEQGGGSPSPFGSAPSPFASRSTTNNNPYAAPMLGADPRDSLAGMAVPGDLTHRHVEMGDLLQTAWDAFQRQFGMGIVLGLVFAGVNVGISMITQVLIQIGAATGETAVIIVTQVLGQIISFFGQTWLQFGLALAGLRWARTGQIQVADVFAVGPFYLRALGLAFFTNLIIFAILLVLAGIPALIAVPFQEPAAIVIAASIGAVVAFPIIIYIALSLYIASYFILDRNAGVIDAMKLSNQYMAGNRGSMLLTGLVVGTVGGLLIIVTCCIGSLAVVPFGTLIAAIAYLKITGQPLYQPMGIGGMK